MKKCNRILSLLMALALLFSLAPAASAAMRIDGSEVRNEINHGIRNDNNPGILNEREKLSMDYGEAEELLSGLKIMKDDNTSPTNTISREEMAGMITRLVLPDYTPEEIAAMYGKYENPFSDVTDEEWGQGYIGYVTRTGIIEGRGAHTFDPRSEVTDLEASRMLMRTLGYDTSPEDQTAEGSGEPLTREEAAEMQVRALSAIPNYGDETLAEQNYGKTVPELQQKIAEDEGELLVMGETHYYDASQLESNKSFDNYDDRNQSENRDAARTVVGAGLIPTYKLRHLNYLFPSQKYTWADAAQMIAMLELGKEESAKLADGGMAYCREKGYIPDGQEGDTPITGTDLVRILSTLMGSKVWLESSAGQFASLYGLLEGASGRLSQADTNLETMEGHTKLNQLLAHPLSRDNAMQMIYNFLKAPMLSGDGTVAEHFGIDMAKYVPPKATAPADEAVYYITAVHTPTQQTVNVAVNVPPNGNNFNVSIYPAGNHDGMYDQEGYNPDAGASSYTVEVPADTQITVDVINAIITKILSGETVLFNVAQEAEENTVSNTPTHTLSSGSNDKVEWVVTENGMSASFNSGTEDVTVETAELTTEGTATVETEEADGTVGEPLTIQINPATDSEAPGEDNGSDPDAQPALMSLRPADNPPTDTPTVETPPEDMPPVETPPVETPPADTPPVDALPVETPPVNTPPADTPPTDTPTADQTSGDE